MNKDALLATIIGFGIGLLITGLLLVGPNILKLLPAVRLPELSFLSTQKNQPTPTPAAKQNDVTIGSPLSENIESSRDLLVSGSAPAGATVVIAGPLDESVVTAKSDGTFAGNVTLAEGKNDLTVTAYSAKKTFAATVTVYYTQEQL